MREAQHGSGGGIVMSELVKCEVCDEWCHGLPDGTPRCLRHLPEAPADVPAKPQKPENVVFKADDEMPMRRQK